LAARDDRGRALHQLLAMVQHDEPVHQVHHGVHRMLDHHDGDAGGGQRAGERDDLLRLSRAQAGQRLVH